MQDRCRQAVQLIADSGRKHPCRFQAALPLTGVQPAPAHAGLLCHHAANVSSWHCARLLWPICLTSAVTIMTFTAEKGPSRDTSATRGRGRVKHHDALGTTHHCRLGDVVWLASTWLTVYLSCSGPAPDHCLANHTLCDPLSQCTLRTLTCRACCCLIHRHINFECVLMQHPHRAKLQPTQPLSVPPFATLCKSNRQHATVLSIFINHRNRYDHW